MIHKYLSAFYKNLSAFLQISLGVFENKNLSGFQKAESSGSTTILYYVDFHFDFESFGSSGYSMGSVNAWIFETALAMVESRKLKYW